MELASYINKDFEEKIDSVQISNLIHNLGQKTLTDTMKQINFFLKMKLYKPKFWDKNIGFFSIVLAPLSLITSFVVFLKKILRKKLNLKYQ